MLLEARNLQKSFFDVTVLRDVTFSLDRGEVLGVVGENGAGKSTLMNILGGVLSPDGGEISLEGRPYSPGDVSEANEAGLAFIHQELNLFSNLSVAENLLLTELPRRSILGARLPFVDRQAMLKRARSALDVVGLDLDPRTPVSRLSPGERQLSEIARALASEARLVIFDEPTTSLTATESERLFDLIGELRTRAIAIIYISHDLEDVFRLCDRLIVLRDGELVDEQLRDGFDVDKVVSAMVGREIGELFPARESRARPDVVLEARGLVRGAAVRGVSFELHAGEVVGLSGLMGAGRTELARLLFGLDRQTSGEIELLGERVERLATRERIARGLAYLTEDRREEGLLMEAGVDENVSLASLDRFSSRFGVIDDRAVSAAVSRGAASVKLRGAGLRRQPVKTLSGGNQQKVVLLKWLLREASVLVLDEPTRGIDIGARHEIYRLITELAAQGAGVLLISSELEELMGLCDRILVMREGEITLARTRDGFDREELILSALGGGAGS